MQWLNYHHLYYFWVIANEGGVTKACKKLHLSQPTLSGQLKQFENFIGKPLFDRKSRKLILNDSGRLVFEYADQIFKKGKELIEAVQKQTDSETINLNVGILPSLPKKDVYDIIKRAINRKNTFLTIKMDSIDKLLKKLHDNELDMIISHFKAQVDEPGKAFSYLLERVPVAFVGGKDDKVLRKKFPASLDKKQIFIPTHKSHIRNEIDLFFQKYNINPIIKGEVQDTELLRVIASSGAGIVTVEKSAVGDLIKSKDIVVIGQADILSDIYLITNELKRSHPLVRSILKKYGAL